MGLIVLLLIALALLLALLTVMLTWEVRHPPRHTAAYALARGMASDPSDLGLQFEEWALGCPDGAVMPVWDIKGEKPRDDGASNVLPLTAVFIHGWGHSRIDLLERIELFVPWCDRIVLYDLRGHGEARGSASCLGDGEQHDLLALLERLGDTRIVLVGFSMGAVIALAAASEAVRRRSHFADRIAGVIAYAPYSDFHASLCGRLRVAKYPSRPITDLALLVLRIGGLSPLQVRDQDLVDVHCPLLVIHGNSDAVAPVEDGRRFANAAPNGKCVEIHGAAHSDVHRVEGTRHGEAIDEFFQHIRQTSQRENYPPPAPLPPGSVIDLASRS
jgi:pimeloyl-ACP methyl ester carboxylesterase